MTDTISSAKRSELMSKIRGRDTGPERAVRQALRRRSIRYRSQARVSGATVDLVLPDSHTVILVHGCFWHACRYHFVPPKSNEGYWNSKIAATKERDRKQVSKFRRAGWEVLVLWEHSLRVHPDTAVERLITDLHFTPNGIDLRSAASRMKSPDRLNHRMSVRATKQDIDGRRKVRDRVVAGLR